MEVSNQTHDSTPSQVPALDPSFQKGASGQHVKRNLKFLNHELNRKSSNLLKSAD